MQDLAYQALENLAFDTLTADINSVADGRLQVIFHVKGRSDPPTPQQAEGRHRRYPQRRGACKSPSSLPAARPST